MLTAGTRGAATRSITKFSEPTEADCLGEANSPWACGPQQKVAFYFWAR